MNICALLLTPAKGPDYQVVVRVRTSTYPYRNGFVRNKSVTVLRKHTTGHDFVNHDIEMIGADLFADKIVNLNSVDDGLYIVSIVDIKRDWETGYVDDYRYRLIPYTPCPPPEKTA